MRSEGRILISSNLRPLKGVVVTPLSFFTTTFLPNKLHQTLLCNHFYILYASFHVYEVKFGGVVWVCWVIKENEGGGGEIQ